MNIKKRLPYILILVIVCFLTLFLSACFNGSKGVDGRDGKSAYQIWLDNGYTGTQADFLEWLRGDNGTNGTNGTNGQDGLSAYEIWLDNGHIGTEIDFLNWLKGDDGSAGTNGTNGQDGLSAYEIFLKYYPSYTGTEEQWINEIASGKLKIHTVTFKNEGNEDIIKYTFDGYALTDIPEIPEKTGNIGKWSIEDFSNITSDLKVTAIYETKGLEFTLTEEQTSYKVSKGNMSTQTNELYIPAEHNGKPVNEIDEYAFMYIKFTIAHIPETFTEIQDYAFYNCSSLTTINIPNGVSRIGNAAFANCYNLTDITIPNSVSIIGGNAFLSCHSLTSITIPNNVFEINYSEFCNCSSLTNIIIPSSVKSIGAYAFEYCDKLKIIYYTGTQAEFNKIDITNEENESFINATVYYYSETEPADEGNYWHYDIDGTTPVIWAKEN